MRTALARCKLQAAVFRLDQFRLIGEFRGGILSSRAADEKLSLVFRIEVDQHLARKESFFHPFCTVHAGFFGDGEDTFDLSHGRVAFQQGQTGCDADPVVRT